MSRCLAAQKNTPSPSADASSGDVCEYRCPLEQLSRRLEQLGLFEYSPRLAPPRLAIACSGGGDSLALLLLCKEWWLKKYGNSFTSNLAKKSSQLAKTKAEKCCEHSIVALICDHRMRAESTSECQKLKEVIEKQFKLSANILTAQSFANQRGNIQQNMRHFRIKVCQEWCRKNAVIHLLFGHTQDDQVETFLLQQTNQLRGSGAMQELRYARHVRIIRPMLEIKRQDLRRWLVARNISWLEDPSNQSSNYARNRLRHKLEAGEKHGGENSIRSILDTCRQIRTTNFAIDRELENFIAQYVALYPEGYARIESREFLKLQELPAQRLISSLAQRVGGRHVRSSQVKHVLPLWMEKLESFLAKRSPASRLRIHPSVVEQHEKQENKPPIISLGRTILLANKSRGIDKVVSKSIGEQNGFLIVRAQLAAEELDITLHKEDCLARRQNPLWDGRYRILPAFKPREELSQKPPSPSLQQPLSLTCRLLGRIGIEQLRSAAKNKASQEDDAVVQAMQLFEALHARVRAACPAFWQKNQLLALPTLKIYRNFPPPETRVMDCEERGYEEKDCWLSTKENAQLPKIRWETIEQQNIEKNTIFNLRLSP